MTERPAPVRTPDDHPDDATLAERLRDVLAERGRATNGDVRAVLDGIPALPDRDGTSRRSWVAAAAAVVLLALGGAFVLGRLSFPRVGGPADRVGADAFHGDPRLAACEAQMGATASQVFEMTHAEWFPLYFPGWYRGAPELEVDDPALVVIGPSSPGLRYVPLPSGAPEPEMTPSPSFPMCIAIGGRDDATVHEYGPTWFDRIVPVLSAADVARAAHLDPDVLADPAAWAFPDRLAPCGGITGNELYIFEASRLEDMPLYFPATSPDPRLNVDAPAIVVVYRDPLPLRGPLNAPPYGPADHDLCVAIELDHADPDHLILAHVDTTGFHVRIDKEIEEPPILAPGATPIPSSSIESPGPAFTPEPLPAWAGDATAVLDCDRPPVERAPLRTTDVVAADTPDTVLFDAIDAIRQFDYPLPTSGYEVLERVPEARLYVVRGGGHVLLAMVVTTVTPGDESSWRLASVASCDPSELEPSTPTGRDPFGTWTTGDGARPPTSTLRAVEDCYQGTQVFYEGRLFVRIPHGGVDESQLQTTWVADMALPATAIDTGLRSGELRLYRSAAGGALYVANGDRAERLPHVIGDEVQRTDCN